ncbi:MAG: hypothetical protein IJB35_00265 [Oscillospiraceae bacterium]|nr:hypothetical protein [Oscillospiraceae bacterium]
MLFAISLCLSLCPMMQGHAAYANDYSGGMSGDNNGIYAHGLDLSAWQGDSVDFERIKSQGYQFVILRAGYATSMDKTFERNYSHAKAAGLDVGVYVYSYAESTEEAAQEAAACKSWLSGKRLEYPVYYDIEDPQCHGDMSSELLTQIALTFLDELAADGWLVGLYSCRSWLEGKLNTEIICQNYECWMAQFVSDSTYSEYDRYDGIYGMWQYSCTGSVEGVPGGVDMNVCFKDYPAICRQYGFNGYEAAGETLYFSGAAAPTILTTGESFSVSGKVTSNRGNLSNVTAGIYDESGDLLTGRSGSSNSKTYDLSQLDSGVREETLPEGKYFYRVTATNTYETRVLWNQVLWVSESGIVSQNVSVPVDLKEGDNFLPTGQVLSGTQLEAVGVYVKNTAGTVYCEASALPDDNEFDLEEFSGQLDTTQLTMGSYLYCVEANTHEGMTVLVSEKFSVWKKDDPLTLEDFSLQTEYYPGELMGLSGTVNSQNSRIRELEISIYNSSEECVTNAWIRKNAKSIALSDCDDELHLETLPIGIYRCEITAVNNGGPVTLLNTSFLIRNDNISLCGLSAPHVLYIGDSFLLKGVVACDISLLESVSVNVYDAENRCVLSEAAVPKGSAFDLSLLNDGLHFSKLACGEYELRITAKNERNVIVLYDAPFAVIGSLDRIVQSEDCMDPLGIAYATSTPFALTGSLRSESSDLSFVAVEILDEQDRVAVSASTQPASWEFDLSVFNEMLRPSALPEGSYRIRITAENAQGCFVMMDSEFSVTSCPHSNVRAGLVYPASCTSGGAVCDSSCIDCGARVRRGVMLEKTEHFYRHGYCDGCSRMEYITVTVEQTAQMPEHLDRLVIAVKNGENWYALGTDGNAVPLSEPDENGRLYVTADLLWTVTSSRGGCYLSDPFGRKLHLDSSDIAIAAGCSNADLVFQPSGDAWKVALNEGVSRFLNYGEGSFFTGEEGAEVILLTYLRER